MVILQDSFDISFSVQLLARGFRIGHFQLLLFTLLPVMLLLKATRSSY